MTRTTAAFLLLSTAALLASEDLPAQEKLNLEDGGASAVTVTGRRASPSNHLEQGSLQ